MRMSVCLTFLSFFFTMTVFDAKTDEFTLLKNCGPEKYLYDAHGVIQTPNFPRAFPVPIRCRWVIDASNFTGVGKKVEIHVYLTQLFVTTGLNITEYVLYEKESQKGYSGSSILQLPVQPGKEYVFVPSNCTYLVIDFGLDMLEGNHLRALYGLMDVYGFNITYEVSTTGERKAACTVNECSLVGHCYASADFSSYKCSCFEGFYGENCGYGPLCEPGKNSCANGATCRHTGEPTAICLCPEMYTGLKCDVPVINSASPDSIYRTIQCSVEERNRDNRLPCDCKNPVYANETSDRVRYTLTAKLITGNATENSLTTTTTAVSILRRMDSNSPPEGRILYQIDRLLRKAKLTRIESLRMINSTRELGLATFVFHFFGNRFEESKVRDVLKNITQKNLFPNATFSSYNESSPHILTLSTNVNQSVEEGDEFSLSCIAYGSRSMSFHWYKDGVPINVTQAIRGMWSHTEPYYEQKYAGVLSIQRAEVYDSGTYTCQVKDWEREQCKSINVAVVQIARYRMQPLYKTVNKGENLTILCLAKNSWDDEWGYIWARNSGLVKMTVPTLYYEDLHRGGSVLHVNNIQKSETFRCNSASVRIDVLDRSRTPFCKEDGVWNLTIPGVVALLQCPENYLDNVARRLCLMVDAHSAEWQLPDYSNCISNTFSSITENFHKVTLGYQNDSVAAADTLKAVWSSLSADQELRLYPGEGEPIVNFLKLVCDYLKKTLRWQDFRNSTRYFFDIIDLLLQDTTSVINQEAMYTLTNLIESWTSLSMLHGFSNLTFGNTSQFKSFEFHVSRTAKPGVRLYRNVLLKFDDLSLSKQENESAKLGIVLYKNLSHILLPKFASNSWNDKQLLYELVSPIVHVLLPENSSHLKRSTDASRSQTYVVFQLPLHQRVPMKWDVCCGLVPSFGKKWSLDMCNGVSLSTSALRCSVNRTGLFAIFAAELPGVDPEMNRKYHIFVIVGCMLCFLQCIISLCVLLFRWLKIRSCLIYLKIQICASTASAMLLFLYGSCDPSTDMFPYILSGLQMFLLASVSSHISILMVMYIDIISLKKIPNVKVSAISVMTVSPMLLIVFAPLSRKMNDEPLTYWWLRRGTSLFYINFIVGLVFLLLFIFLYCSVMKKLFFLWNATKVERRVIIQRISFVHYTTLIFLTTVFMVISSTVYVNIRTSASQCVFGSSCALLGFAIFLCYIPRNEIFFCLKIVFPALKYDTQKYSPELQVIPIQSGILRNNGSYEIESLHSSHSNLNAESVCLNVYGSKVGADSQSKPRKKKSVVFPPELVTGEEEQSDFEETIVDQVDSPTTAPTTDGNTASDVDKEATHETAGIPWPVTQHNYISTSSCADGARCCSPLHQSRPEMLTTRVCVELGVMKKAAADSALPGDNGSTVVICSVDVEPCPGHIVELNEVKFTANAIGSLCPEGAQKLSEPRVCETTLSLDKIEPEDRTDVLDRISQDLDYLLNRSPSPTKSRNLKLVNNNQKIVQNHSCMKPRT